MADKKMSEFDDAAALQGDEYIPGVQNTGNVKTSVLAIAGMLPLADDDGNAIIKKPNGTFYVPNQIRNGLAYGGSVAWVSGYSYHIEATGAYINSILYEAAATSKTLSAADGTYDRIDAFVIDTAGTIQVVEGTPAANPQIPNISLSQILLSFAIVKVGTTEPDLNVDEIYQENTEWTTASSNSGRINPAATASPITGAKDIEATAPLNTDYITFTRGSAVYAAALNDVLVFTIKPKSGTGIRKLRLSFTLSGTKVGKYVTLKNGSFGYDITSLTAQIIIIPLTSFGLATSQSVDGLKIENQTAGYGWFMDDISLQKTAVIGTTVIREFADNASAIAGGLKEGNQYSGPMNELGFSPMNIVREIPDIPANNWQFDIVTTTANQEVHFSFAHPQDLTFVLGDGTFVKITDSAKITFSHFFKTAGTYTINIWGSFTGASGSGFANGTGDTNDFAILINSTSAVKGITGLKQVDYLFNGVAIPIIPADIFDAYSDIESFVGCFSSCAELTGAAPALWTDFPSADGTDCFTDDTGLSNYATIPNDWKGL